ncbi:MAG: hypothetical protein ABW086_08590 [Sedimenticola sp.]
MKEVIAPLIVVSLLLISCSEQKSELELTKDDFRDEMHKVMNSDRGEKARGVMVSPKISIVAIENVGDKVNPIYKARFIINFKAANDLYEYDQQTKCGHRYGIIQLLQKKGASQEVHGVASARYKAGKWAYTWDTESDTIGNPLTFLKKIYKTSMYQSDSNELKEFIDNACREQEAAKKKAREQELARQKKSQVQALTEKRLAHLVRSIKVWMIQYGSGFNPNQVTLPQLRRDLGLPAEDFLDSWGINIRYEPGEGGYKFRSAGPDGAFGTSDDLLSEGLL